MARGPLRCHHADGCAAAAGECAGPGSGSLPGSDHGDACVGGGGPGHQQLAAKTTQRFVDNSDGGEEDCCGESNEQRCSAPTSAVLDANGFPQGVRSMSTSALPPIAPTTLVIFLGASAWPNSPGFQPSPAFVHASLGFNYYVLNP